MVSTRNPREGGYLKNLQRKLPSTSHVLYVGVIRAARFLIDRVWQQSAPLISIMMLPRISLGVGC